MENATKAMFIAAGVLMGVMILSLGAALFLELSSYVESSHEEIRFNELNKFNTQFMQYINYVDGEKQFDLTIQDIITAANLAYQNNIDYNVTSAERGNESNKYVAVRLKNKYIEDTINEEAASLLQDNIADGVSVKQYKCEADDIKISEVTGRVYEIVFHEE